MKIDKTVASAELKKCEVCNKTFYLLGSLDSSVTFDETFDGYPVVAGKAFVIGGVLTTDGIKQDCNVTCLCPYCKESNHYKMLVPSIN
ncbi:TPA: hypothetical protein QCY54_003101 [Bacillus cereus]|nr:hypothetical protein [Bacillus cereus]